MAHPLRPFVVSIETSVSGGARPIVTGTTNLPGGTQLYILVKKPWLPNGKERLAMGLSACGDDCFPLQTNSKLPDGGAGLGVVVKNGHFSDGPFTDNGAALRPGEYVLEVSVYFAATQPADVRAIIGPLGENMTGPLVGGCCFGAHMSQAEIQKELDKLRSATPTVGASIYYARYVEIGESEQSNPLTAAQTTAVPQTRVANCQAMRRGVQDWTLERQEAYRRQGCWQRLEAENGAAYQIDLGLIQSFAAGATTVVYNDEGGGFSVVNLKRWYFTCEGHFSVMGDHGSGPTLYALPRSVARHISDIVCAGAGVEPRRN